jgi:cobalt-zinc-cadmium efflux system outer membrane protein
MGPKILVLLVLGFVTIPRPSVAADLAPSCQPNSYTEFVQCAERISSDIRISEQQLKAASKLEDVAQQGINPELEAESLAKGERSETTASLLFTLRLGGKSGALINEARSELQKSQATRDLSVQQARLEIMMSLYRLSQLKSEIQIEEESVSTFSKIVDQFQKRAALSPEQQVSLSVFKMAEADRQLRLTRLKADQEKFYFALVATTGISRAAIAKSLPSRKEKWPELAVESEIDVSPQAKQAEAELRLARSQKEIADAEAWPELKVGPVVKAVKEDKENTTFVGIGLTMPIPILSRNSGNKAYRSQRVMEAELVLDQTRRKLQSMRSDLANRYIQTVQSLKSSLSLKTVTEKHEQVEKQFFKGLVPSSLVIEAHRQLFDFEERRNASELEALESYGQLLILDNKFSEVIL